ncbi:hypothetical protein BH20VER3_BH20VER3_04380 [soil metagenome]
MTTLFPILLFGFFLGMRHPTDSDHVVAITTIVSRQRSIGSATWTGFFWGIGHSLTLLVIGGAIILFGIIIPERLGMSLEFCVALMLILLGALNLRSTLRAVDKVSADGGHHSYHQHTHRHGDYIHSHTHGHERSTHGHAEEAVPPAKLDRWFGSSRFYQALRSIAIGIVHGLAGSAVVALLVLPIIHDPLWAMAYLLIFGIGTNRQHDAHHGGDRSAGFLFDPVPISAPASGHCVRSPQPRLRVVPRLPDRLRPGFVRLNSIAL